MKFTGVMALLVSLTGYLLFRRGVLDRAVFLALTGVAAAAVVAGLFRPRWFRSFYRGGMTASWHVGQVMGRVVLAAFFFVIVTPMGLLLRLAGKDLLELRKPRGDTCWKPCRAPSRFDRQF